MTASKGRYLRGGSNLLPRLKLQISRKYCIRLETYDYICRSHRYGDNFSKVSQMSSIMITKTIKWRLILG